MVDCFDNDKKTGNSEGGIIWSQNEDRERTFLRRQQLKQRSAHSSRQYKVDICYCPPYRQPNSGTKPVPLFNSEYINEVPKRSHSAPYSRIAYDDIWDFIGLGQTMTAFTEKTDKLLDRQSKRRLLIMGQAKQSSEAQEVIHQLKPETTETNGMFLQDSIKNYTTQDQKETVENESMNDQTQDITSECEYVNKNNISTKDNCTTELTEYVANQHNSVDEPNKIKTKRRKKIRRTDRKMRTSYLNDGKTSNSSRMSMKKTQHRTPRVGIHVKKSCPSTKIGLPEENAFVSEEKGKTALPLITPQKMIREKSFQLTYPGYDIRFKEPILTREPTIPAVDQQIQKEIRDSSVEKCRMWLKNWAIN